MWLRRRVLEGREESERTSDVDIKDDMREESQTSEVEDEQYLIGQENLLLSYAARTLLGFLASELSEMVASCWTVIMLPILYYSPNKTYMYTIEDMDEDTFRKAMLFSAINFAMELLTFLAMLLIFYLHLKVHVISVGAVYVNEQKLLLPLLSLCVMLIWAGGGFFIKHWGADPTFKCDEYDDSR